ncbi:MAG: hypothetical protein L0177_10965 [Chloroflexi bacterium]|nr:hypothetical protein [Chloroflexota bacterium]
MARSWEGTGEYILEPHEDLSQITSPVQDGFEIQGAATYSPVAFNVYLSNPSGSGATVLWNLHPSPAAIARLGLRHRGHPIPLDVLADLPSTRVAVGPGDVLAFNGAFIHAVEGLGARQRRSALAFFASHVSGHETVYWT